MDRRKLLSSGLALAAAPLVATIPAAAEEKRVETGFLNRSLAVGDTVHPYVVYVPKTYDAAKKWPTILFLHGAGERGTDGLAQSDVGIGRAIRFFSDRYPAIVVMPQCLPNQNWSGAMLDMAVKTLDKTLMEFSTDLNRLYLTGLSMGGFGSFLLASNGPGRFAAVMPICGGGNPAEMAPKLKDTPMWVFHGDADQAVPVQRSRDMVEAIKAAGGTKIKYTEYPGVPHNSWDKAYSEKEMTDWLFAQKLP
jgi:predicted peptidase